MLYQHHRLKCHLLTWRSVADEVAGRARQEIEGLGENLYGIRRPQIGRPRDEITVITAVADVAMALSITARFGQLESHQEPNC